MLYVSKKGDDFMKKMQVDRFEENLAVLMDENEEVFVVLRDAFGFELHEGDHLEVEFSGEKPVSAKYLAEETEASKKRVHALMERLKNKKK